jgi:hypothetical protein
MKDRVRLIPFGGLAASGRADTFRSDPACWRAKKIGYKFQYSMKFWHKYDTKQSRQSVFFHIPEYSFLFT